MKPQSISVAELATLSNESVPQLSAEDVYRLLAAKVLRGRLVGAAFFTVSLAGLIYTLLILRETPWTVASGLASGVFGFIFFASQRKLAMAQRITSEPRLVFWVHPTILRQPAGGYTISHK
jgi:hypothetical protein